jgi:hypothetical protein
MAICSFCLRFLCFGWNFSAAAHIHLSVVVTASVGMVVVVEKGGKEEEGEGKMV